MASDGTLKFDTSLDSGGLQSGMGKVASIAQQALGVFSGQMMTRAVDSLVNLGKTALDSVGALEQNVGGVETLFGDTADAVIAAADRAYQTAGMSANDYMSTVTSFSASLLQSLSGNTEEAAKVADMAIIDMADNANKMGTSMDMIQNAYQGFAKQNYTMLDNLKLGYGGTKTEMERLLADAQELTGVKYDINNLNDVYQAIHVIQEEMGITGTTAKEASETLEGSMAAAKAAWDNFMNGSSDADQLADAFSTAADNIVNNLAEIVPRFAETLPALAGAIVEQIPDLAAAIAPAVLSAGQSILEQARDAVLEFDFVGAAEMVVESITDFINGDGLRSFLGCLVDIFTGIVNGISSMLPTLLPALVELISYTVTTLIDQLPALLDCALQLIIGLADGLLAAIPVLIESLPEIIDAIVQFLISSVPEIIDAGIQLLGALIEAIPVIVVELGKAVPDIITAIIDVLADLPALIGEVFSEILADLQEWGADMGGKAQKAITDLCTKVSNVLRNLPGQIWTHLVNAVNKVIAWGTQLAQKGAAAATQLFNSIVNGLASLPSKMAEIGSNIISGIWNGISSGWSWLTNKVSSLANSLLDAAKNALGINSPSKEFADEVGRWIMPGVGKGMEKTMPATLKDMEAKANELVSAMRAEMSASAGSLAYGASHAAGLRMAGAGTTVYYDNRMEQSNTYNVPVATPSEVAKKQREALRNMVGGVK